MFKQKIKDILKSLKGDANPIEIAFWWLARLCFIITMIRDDDPLHRFLLGVNLLCSFGYDIFRLIFPRSSFMWRTSFHLQTIFTFSSFAGYFMTNFTNIRDYIPKYDFLLHFISGFTMFYIGYNVICALDKRQTASRNIRVFSSIGFSAIVIIMWEILEFFSDYFIPDSTNQAYNWEVPDDFFFFKLAGFPQAGAAQYPLMDTMFDMIFAMIATLISALVLNLYLIKKNK